jgi:hypothetical protein
MLRLDHSIPYIIHIHIYPPLPMIVTVARREFDGLCSLCLISGYCDVFEVNGLSCCFSWWLLLEITLALSETLGFFDGAGWVLVDFVMVYMLQFDFFLVCFYPGL